LPPTVIYQDTITNRHYTYGTLRETALSFGQGLKAHWSWRKGQVLLLFTPNCVDTPAITLGTLWAGGIVSPANPAYTAQELAFQLKDAGARAVVTQRPFLDTVLRACEIVGLGADMVALMGEDRDPSGRFKHFTSIRNVSGTSRWRKQKVDPANDLAFLVYSSGTTGLPKGVMLSHRNVVSNVMQLGALESGNLHWRNDKVLAFLPFYHIYGLYISH
jgi:4-coumarate--CoA ligase